MSFRVKPYTRTDGCNGVTYCQLDEVELYDTSELRTHANKVILDLQNQLTKVTQERDKAIGHIKDSRDYIFDLRFMDITDEFLKELKGSE